MLKKVFLLALLLLPANNALADEQPVGDWVLFGILRDCGGDFSCFDKRVDYLVTQNIFSVASRAISGERIVSANIKRIRQGRNYQKKLYYTTYLESYRTHQGWQECSMKVYYDPDSGRIKYLERDGACYRDRLPDIPGLEIESAQDIE